MVTFGIGQSPGKLDTNIIKNLKDIGKLGLGSRPTGTPPGTVPLGDGWYATPDTPADPQDCVRYPNSPWCKVGLPDWKKPVSIDISPKVHQCGFDIELTGTLAYLPLPTSKLSYRYEGDCRKEPPPPPPPPVTDDSPRTVNMPGAWPNDSFYMFWHEPDQPSCGWTGFICPGIVEYVNNYDYASEINGVGFYSRYVYDANGVGYYLPTNVTTGYRRTASPPYGTYIDYSFDINGKLIEFWEQGTYFHFQQSTSDPTVFYTVTGRTTETIVDTVGEFRGHTGMHIIKGRYGAISNWAVNYCNVSVQCDFLVDQACSVYNPHYRNPPPEPPPKDCDCNMTCCPDYSSLINQILNEIRKLKAATPTTSPPVDLSALLAEIKKANTALGSDDWVTSKVPANLLVKNGLSNAQVPITSLNAWCEWYSKQFDALMGRWKIDIEVEHPDPTNPQASPVKMNLPNMSEGIAEIMGLLIHISMNVDALTNVGTRTLIQSGQASQQAFVNWMLLSAIQDYMGFADEDQVRELTLMFKPNETDLSKLLKETNVKVKGIKFKKGAQRLRDALHDLLRGAAIIAAVHWRKLDSKKGNYGQQLFDLISGTAGMVENIGDPKDKTTKQSDFDKFINDFETGFTEHTGLDKDLQTPYGRPYDERPQVKKLSGAPKTPPPGASK